MPHLVLVVVACFVVACGSGGGDQAVDTALDDDAITVASFDFAESQTVAEVYSQALEAGGYEVHRAFGLGPREFVAPALVKGLVELVPEYAGTAVRFLSLGDVAPGEDPSEAHEALRRALESAEIVALEAAPGQDANTFVVTRQTAERHGLESLSDLADVAPELTFGGPPECENRPLCLVGLRDVYGIDFKEVVALDVGGAVTRQALENGYVDVVLLFTTDPSISAEGYVELYDDRALQPAENLTPLVRAEVVERWGPEVVERIDAVSSRLTTGALRELNAEAGRGGADVAAVARAWLRAQSLV